MTTLGSRHSGWAALAMMLAALLMVGCGGRRAETVPAAESAELNTRATIKLVGIDNRFPAQSVAERLARHQSIHALIQVPEGKEPGGPLLDPNSVVVELDGRPLETYLLYRNPSVALVFATVGDDRPTTGTELSITARFVDEADMAAGWRLPLSFTPDQLARLSTEPIRTGRTIRVLDEAGNPMAGALVFGQRREDLFARTDADGNVVLDAPTRNSFETHFAWSPGTWVTRFDAIREPEPRLVPREGNSTSRKVRLDLRDAEGNAIPDAWLLVNDADWVRYRAGKSVRLPLRTDRANLLNVIAPGFQVKAIEFDKKPAEKRLTLERLKS